MLLVNSKSLKYNATFLIHLYRYVWAHVYAYIYIYPYIYIINTISIHFTFFKTRTFLKRTNQQRWTSTFGNKQSFDNYIVKYLLTIISSLYDNKGLQPYSSIYYSPLSCHIFSCRLFLFLFARKRLKAFFEIRWLYYSSFCSVLV